MSKTVSSLKGFLDRIGVISREYGPEYNLYFRGHSKKSYENSPFLFRSTNWVKNENQMFNQIIMEHPQDFSNDKTTLEKLVRMQHYGLPTRLLDLTSNPLVALYFACKSNREETGEVIAFAVPKKDIKYFDSDTVSIIANLSRLTSKDKEFSITRKSEVFNKTENVHRLLHQIREEKPYFEALINPTDIHRTVCVVTKMNNSRIVVQSGAFFLFGIGGSKMEHSPLPNEWIITQDGSPHKRILLNNGAKVTLMKNLELLNIKDGTLFPGLEKTANEIKARFN